MGVLHDYECAAHGEFESFEQKCPHGCSSAFVRLIWKKPPAIKHNRTKVADTALRALASDYGLTDIQNDKEGGSVMDAMRKGESFAPRFVDIPHAAPGWSHSMPGQPARQPVIVDPSAAIGGTTVGGINAPAAEFGLNTGEAGPGSDGRANIPRPRPIIDPKLVYRPSELPSAPE